MNAMNSFASNLFGAGLLDPELEKRLSQQQRQQLNNSAWMDAGLAMLAASGPSSKPISLGQALAEAVGAGRSSYAQQAQPLQAMVHRQLQAEAEEKQRQGMIEGIASMDPQMAQFARDLDPASLRQLIVGVGKERAKPQKRPETFRDLSPEEKRARGIDPNSPAQVNETTGRVVGAQRPPVTNINMGAENQFAKAMAGKDADTLSAWRDSAMSAGSMLDQLDVLKQINNLEQGGKLGEAAAIIGQYFGSDAGSNYQVFTTVSKNLLLKQAEALKGALSDRDIQMVQDSLAKYGNDSRANLIVIGLLENAANRTIQNFQSADDHAYRTGSLRGYKPIIRAAAPSVPVDSAKVSIDAFSADEIEAELRRRGIK